MPGPGAPAACCIAIHHLAVDGVSWRILVPDLASAWQAIAAGRPSRCRRGGPRSGAGRSGLRCMRRTQRRPGAFVLAREQSEPSLLLVEDRLDPARDTLGAAGHLTLTLPSAVTEALLTRVPAAFHGGIDDVLLTGLALAVADWCRRQGGRCCRCSAQARIPSGRQSIRSRGSHAVLLDLEGHGREEGFGREEIVPADIDLTRTVGWFTSLYPVRLDPGPLDLEEALSGGAALAGR